MLREIVSVQMPHQLKILVLGRYITSVSFVGFNISSAMIGNALAKVRRMTGPFPQSVLEDIVSQRQRSPRHVVCISVAMRMHRQRTSRISMIPPS